MYRKDPKTASGGVLAVARDIHHSLPSVSRESLNEQFRYPGSHVATYFILKRQ